MDLMGHILFLHLCSTGLAAVLETSFLSESTDIVWPGDIAQTNPYTAIDIKYRVEFDTRLCDKCKSGFTICCPSIYFYTWDLLPKDEFNSLPCPDKEVNFTKRTDSNNWRISFSTDCDTQTPNISRCAGHVAFAQAVAKRFAVSFGSCESQAGVHLNYTLELQERTSVACRNMIPGVTLLCNEMNYSSIAMPGTLGYRTQEEMASKLQSMARDWVAKAAVCYQHPFVFACRSAAPECKNGLRFFPCRQMCHDFVTGCRSFMEEEQVAFSCENFLNSLDPNLCHYEAVACPYLSLMHGHVYMDNTSVNDTAVYSCDEGYILIGSAARTCQYNGHWNGSTPYCQKVTSPRDNSEHILFPVGIVSGLILIIGIATGSIIHIKNKRRTVTTEPHTSELDIKYDAFVSYSSMDAEYVEEEFRRKLEIENDPQLRLCLHGRDFLPGERIHDNILKSIEKSATCLMMVSRNYVGSSWCNFEFSVAHSRMVTDKLPSSSMVLVFLDDLSTTELPSSVRTYTYTSTYIKMSSPNFWESITNAIMRARTDAKISEGKSLWKEYALGDVFPANPYQN